MPWNNHYLMLLDEEDDNLCIHADHIKRHHAIPSVRCFSNWQRPGYITSACGFLATATLSSKLIVVSHGSAQHLQIGDYRALPRDLGAPDLARFLVQDMGLRAIGLISFKSCLTGQGIYLDFLLSSLRVLGPVDVGWLIGYRGYSAALTHHNSIGWLDVCVRMFTCMDSKLSDARRIRVVRGNAAQRTAPPDTPRFSFDKDPFQLEDFLPPIGACPVVTTQPARR